MGFRDVAIDECEPDIVGPTFVHGMRVEDVREEYVDVACTYEDDGGRVYDCVVAYDGDSVAWVTAWDERGNPAELSDEQREAIVLIAARNR